MTRFLSYPLAPLVILVLVVGLVILWLAYTVRRERDERVPYCTQKPRAAGPKSCVRRIK